MADQPVFLYAAVYDELADANADYEAVFDLHEAGVIGTFDSAVIHKDELGKVHVTKTEKPTQHAAWTGAAVGALVGIVFPPAIIGSAIVGGAVGAAGGHMWRGLSRSDVKELGDLIDAGQAALLVVGASTLEKALDEAGLSAEESVAKQLDVSTTDVDAAIKDATSKAG